MIKLSLVYPADEGKKFDFDYYCTKHIPMVKTMLGKVCKGITIDQGICGASRELSPAYLMITGLIFESLGEMEAAMAEIGGDAMADIKNFTDIQPVVQVCQVRA